MFGLKPLVKNSPLFLPLYSLLSIYHWVRWAIRGQPIPPPPMFKQKILVLYGKRFGTNTLVETGTALGYTIYAVKSKFRKIYSVELSEELYQRAINNLSRYKHIQIFQGDSAIILPEITKQLDEPALFWLDAHYSGGVTAKGEKETPIFAELAHIFTHNAPNHVVLIDDARCFNGTHDYPTLEALRSYIEQLCPGLVFSVDYDIIRIHRKDPAE